MRRVLPLLAVLIAAGCELPGADRGASAEAGEAGEVGEVGEAEEAVEPEGFDGTFTVDTARPPP